MSSRAFTDHYWLKVELVAFARVLGLPSHGAKPALSARIDAFLRGKPNRSEPSPERDQGSRDSDASLRRETPVIHYKSDSRTRAFFESQIGPSFHFTYYLNQYRLARDGLTYGDLVDEWIAERDRRLDDDYTASIAEHGKYNRYVRDYFADENNQGKSMRDAAASWNAIKNNRGEPRYRKRKK